MQRESLRFSKKALKRIGIIVLTPILLIVVLAALLYLPPVQNWAVKKVVSIASEATGMEITVEHVRLEFPLDLGIEGFRAIKPNDSIPQVRDTIADIRKLVADVRLLPLLKGEVIIDELSLQQAKVNTNGFISDVRIKGEFQELWLSSKGISLSQETIKVNGARLSDASIDIALSDTAAIDTTESDTRWIIAADSLSFRNTALALHLPGDTLNIHTFMGQAVAHDANIDLGTSIYRIASIDWRGGELRYDNRYEPEVTGFDYNHIAMSSLDLKARQFEFSPQGISIVFNPSRMKERCGIEIRELSGSLKLDSTYNNIQLPDLILRTADSDILADIDMDFNTFDDQDPGNMKLRLNAMLGKQDMANFIGDLPQSFIRHYPNYPLSIKGSINGNTRQMDFTGLNAELPTAFTLTANGTAENILDDRRLKADIKVSAKTGDINFALAIADPSLQKDYHIPSGIALDGTIQANGTRYTTDLTAREGSGTVKMKGMLDGDLYDADISISELNLHHFMPKDSLYGLTADIKVSGYGTDFLSHRSRLNADATIQHLQYGSWNLAGTTANAVLQDGHCLASVTGHNQLLDGTISTDALLDSKKIDATIMADIKKADLQKMRIVDNQLSVGFSGRVDVNSDLQKTHRLSGVIGNIVIRDKKKTIHSDSIGLLVRTTTDTTYVRAQSGDLIVKFDASNYERLFRQLTILGDSIAAQMEARVIDQPAIKRLFPTARLHVESGRKNPVVELLRISNIDYKELLVDITASPETGLNGSSHLYSLNYDSTLVDTVRLNLTQKGDRLTYQGQVSNNRRNPQFVFNALFDGHIHQHGALAGLRYYDKDNKLGVRIGATAEMEAGGIRFVLMPEKPIIGYKEFNLNKDNYIFLAKDKKIQAKVDLISDDRTGLKIYTENQDSTMLQDLTVSLYRIDLDEVTSVLPYMPRITGMLNGDYHILQDQNGHLSVASDMAVRQMTYDGSPIGNISTEFVYLMKEDDTHAIDARMMLDDVEFGQLSGSYRNEDEGFIDVLFTMNHFPLSIANGFVPDQIVGFEGYGEGSFTVKGSTTHPDMDGEVFVDSAYLISVPYGIRMRLDNDPVRIVDSKVLIENFGLYAYNDEPLNLMGNVDFSNTDRITMDMRMRAQNLQLINSKQEVGSIAWGKAFVNFIARMQGPIEALNIRGRLDVLGSTDLTYLLLDSPLSTDNRLDELVKFTDFEDSTQVVVTRPKPSGLEADLTISIAQGARIVCDLNAEQTNYIDLMGGGDLRMKYNDEGINLTGRYTLSNGQMKYSLPVIPLKTFTVKDGSYVEFTGDPMNPKLNITATERTKAAVEDESGGSRSVTFDCGVVITKTLNDMGLEFIIDAPEDQDINGELTTMSTDERGKVAVTMLTTGMYLADGNTGGFTMNSALSSFLQSEINNITGSALKTLDLSVGIDNATDATGSTRTDYSFKFAKRFFDNRLKIELGGKVSTGASDAMGQTQSFFDNVTMEYRLNQEGTKNMKLFYIQNLYDWLDGYTGEYGAGFVWRRKLDTFWDIFRFRRKETRMPIPQLQQPADTLKTARDENK